MTRSIDCDDRVTNVSELEPDLMSHNWPVTANDRRCSQDIKWTQKCPTGQSDV